jgi:hypothetical protein
MTPVNGFSGKYINGSPSNYIFLKSLGKILFINNSSPGYVDDPGR